MITVIFSSYNGSRTISRMMDAYCRLRVPATGWKVVAVDNASTDDTNALLSRYQDRLPITILSCPVRGKNKALNLALNHIEGELVVLTDDDVLPSEDWLIKLYEAARDNPEYDIFGGSILPEWPRTPPSWVLDNIPLSVVYAVSRHDRKSGEISPDHIWGANMMVRSRIFKEGHRFNEFVGPSAGTYVMGSETEFNVRMVRQGLRCYFVPHASVRHIIRPEQLEKRWILRRAYRYGKSMYMRSNQGGGVVAHEYFGVPRWKLRKMFGSASKALVKGAWFGSERSVVDMWDLWSTAGYCVQAFVENKKTSAQQK